MQLSEHFTLAELTKSQVAVRRCIDNTPGEAEIGNLERLARHILEPVRARFRRPFTPSSGYRSRPLNTAIGSGSASQHIRGEAVDFEIPGVSNLEVARWIRDNLEFDQLILEFHSPTDPSAGWVHCSYRASGNRKEVLTISREGVRLGLPE